MVMRRCLAAVALVATVLVPSAAHAQTPDEVSCNRKVFDSSEKLAGIATVEAAVDRLAAMGMFVRARAESNVGADADARMSELEGSCASWLVDGIRRPNLIVVLVLTDTRKTGIYYGARLAPLLDGHWADIQATAMNPRFKEGSIDTGLIGGLDAITALVREPARSATPSLAPDEVMPIVSISVIALTLLGGIILATRGSAKQRASKAAATYQGSGYWGPPTELDAGLRNRPRQAAAFWGGSSSGSDSFDSGGSDWGGSESGSSDSGGSSDGGGGGSSAW
jgi:uncharacterized membrane protein YgcG